MMQPKDRKGRLPDISLVLTCLSTDASSRGVDQWQEYLFTTLLALRARIKQAAFILIDALSTEVGSGFSPHITRTDWQDILARTWMAFPFASSSPTESTYTVGSVVVPNSYSFGTRLLADDVVEVPLWCRNHEGDEERSRAILLESCISLRNPWDEPRYGSI
jgi:hypothetical protein